MLRTPFSPLTALRTKEVPAISKDSIYLRAARSENSERPPIWIMRQAGRYMEAYRRLKERYSLMELFSTPELAAEVTLQPIQAFSLDAAIIFSDILLLAAALGEKLHFDQASRPHFARPIRTSEDLKSLSLEGLEEKLTFVFQAISIAKERLRSSKTPLIGFAASPFTLACYMISGGSVDLPLVLNLAFHAPKWMEELLALLTEATRRYLLAQIKAGVDAIQIFDSVAFPLSWVDYEWLSIDPLRSLMASFDSTVVRAIYSQSSSLFYPLLEKTGIDLIAFDSQIALKDARRSLRKGIAIQGNLDPLLLKAPLELCKKRVFQLLESMRGERGFVFSLGGAIHRDTEESRVATLVEWVRSFH